MKRYYSITIPKPCHEDWNIMSPKEKGRFCSSCSKTVIDFTKMDTYEIQNFIHQNKQNNICGHFKQTQLDSINLHIPSKVIERQNNLHNIFLLSLLITMGTTLFSCTNKNGNSQKIDSVEVIDTLNSNKVINVLGGLPKIEKVDSVLNINKIVPTKHHKKNDIIEVQTDGEIEIITTGDLIVEESPINLDSLDIFEPTWCPPPPDKNKTEIEGEVVLGVIKVENPPELKNTPQYLSTAEKRDYLSKGISKIIREHFNSAMFNKTNVKGKQKVYVQFQIDTLGYIKNVKARAPHPLVEREATRVVQLLPRFIPAKQNGKPIAVVYSLPIVFIAE